MLAAEHTRLVGEGLRPLPDLAALVPRSDGRPVSIRALVRWIRDGRDGRRLEAVRGAGGLWYSSVPALARFLAAGGGRG